MKSKNKKGKAKNLPPEPVRENLFSKNPFSEVGASKPLVIAIIAAMAILALALLLLFSDRFVGKATAPGCTPPPATVFAWWPLENVVNNVIDDVMGNNDGTAGGILSVVTGEVDNAFSFGGTSYITTPISNLNLQTKEFSFIAWIKPDVTNSDHNVIFSKCLTSNCFLADGSVVFFVNYSTDRLSLGIETNHLNGVTILDNSWHLVTVTYEVTENAIDEYTSEYVAKATLYLDGVVERTGEFTITSPGNSADLEIGRHSGTGYFKGLMDEVVIFDRALTASEVESIASTTVGMCLPICGDGTVNQLSEECDDVVDSATCDADCTLAVCGDGTLNTVAGEECDDGNTEDFDACHSCIIGYCGDSIVQSLVLEEECDDGNNEDGDGCNANCVIEYCGDSIVQAGLDEVCDLTNLNGETCLIHGFDGGTLGCAADCFSFNVGGCTTTCGDDHCGIKLESTTSCLEDCGPACRTDGLIGWWPLESSSAEGVTVVDVFGENHGTIEDDDGDVLPDFLAGKVGNAFNFDGVDDFIEVVTSEVGLTEEMTISLWVKPGEQSDESYGQHNDIIRSGCFGGGGEWAISTNEAYNSNNQINLAIAWIGPGDWWIENSLIAVKDEWNHLVLTMNRDTRKAEFYRNGQLAAEITKATIGVKPTTNSFRIAHDCGGAFNGQVDEIAIFDRVLTTDEILAIYNADNVGMCVPYPYCGDGVVDAGEECDDGNTVNGDECTNVCMLPTCSDTVQNQDETSIDCGGSICSPCPDDEDCEVDSDCLSGYCDIDGFCETPTCSDGAQNQDETFIDCGGVCGLCAVGHICGVDSDCESNNCVNGFCEEAVPVCGNGVVDAGEECDDSDTQQCVAGVIGYRCENCLKVLVATVPEVCDQVDNDCDGSVDEGNVCMLCGDGNLDAGEECDDNNTKNFDGCSSSCIIEFCGDGIIQTDLGEECDDSNTDSGDGCDADCQMEGQVLSTSEGTKVTLSDLAVVNNVFATKIVATEDFTETVMVYTILRGENEFVLAIKLEKIIGGLTVGESYTASVNYPSGDVVKKSVIVYDVFDVEQNPTVYGTLES